MPVRLEDYEVIGVIGSGSFGTCFKVQNIHSEEMYVWKAIDYGNMTEEKKQLLVSEVNLLSELNHPNIVKYFDRILHKETTTIYIIMEWCQGGDLSSKILKAKKSGVWLEEGFIWKVLYQTGRALQACHTRLGDITVLHRDIKPANIFLDAEGNVKLGDFGLARILETDKCFSETIVGTPYYMSPEVMKGAKYNRKADIWALGCLLYEMCALAPPFDGKDIHDLAANIKLGRFNKIPDHYSESLVKMIKLMLTIQHEYRPTVEVVLHHPVVVSNVSKFLRPKGDDRAKLKGALKNLSLTDREPEEVSENTFREKWVSRLEALREKETRLREKEAGLDRKERELVKKEKLIHSMERTAREKIARAEVYLHQCKETKRAEKIEKLPTLNESSVSADPGDTSVLPTTAKLFPELLPKPNFGRTYSERQILRHVHFDSNARTPGNGIVTSHYGPIDGPRHPSGKENRALKRLSKYSISRTAL